MPIISTIGRRSWKVRSVIFCIYVLLGVGAVTMIYPMLLMLSGSVKSDTDHVWITPVPGYLWDDDVLWMKYIESKYATVFIAERALHAPLGSWRQITPPDLQSIDNDRALAFEAFRRDGHWPEHWYHLGHLAADRVLARNAREFRKRARQQHPDIGDYSQALGSHYQSWAQVGPPATPYESRLAFSRENLNYQILSELKRQAPLADRVVINLDGIFWQEYLRPRWATIEAYNTTHDTHYTSYEQVLLSSTAPPEGQARQDWSQYVRSYLGLAFIQIDPSLTPAYRRHLSRRYDGDITQLNALWNSHYESFEQIELPKGAPDSLAEQVNAVEFVRDEQACPLEAMSAYGPRQAFEAFVANQRGVSVAEVSPLQLPVAAVDYADFQQMTGSLRWEFLTRNYIHVLDFILLHGNGIRNTVIYCSLMILVTLIINPLAAYALSRYRPPSTYKVLLFCMVTMAFPAEVTMIPSFLLLKRFPLVSLAVCAMIGIPLALLLMRMFPRWPDWIKGILAGAGGLAAGFYLLPHFFGEAATSVSLLNTFWALVLPGAAQGFMIFLLKGFFDSLPQELYESAEIDGAGEFTKFWIITMSLSKPILAVMALGAFTAAYSEFMMALVIIPDPKMWTLMVWLFQLQSQVHPTVVYASLVIAAIPTFAVFLFCQNLIMRGIVVPVEK